MAKSKVVEQGYSDDACEDGICFSLDPQNFPQGRPKVYCDVNVVARFMRWSGSGSAVNEVIFLFLSLFQALA